MLALFVMSHAYTLTYCHIITIFCGCCRAVCGAAASPRNICSVAGIALCKAGRLDPQRLADSGTRKLLCPCTLALAAHGVDILLHILPRRVVIRAGVVGGQPIPIPSYLLAVALVCSVTVDIGRYTIVRGLGLALAVSVALVVFALQYRHHAVFGCILPRHDTLPPLCG